MVIRRMLHQTRNKGNVHESGGQWPGKMQLEPVVRRRIIVEIFSLMRLPRGKEIKC
jgi:hypothetical protein